LRNDLRIADNPALTAAAARDGPVLPLFIHDDAAAGARGDSAGPPAGGCTTRW
jgi:deoxyribodipyrimidine photo-lyase